MMVISFVKLIICPTKYFLKKILKTVRPIEMNVMQQDELHNYFILKYLIIKINSHELKGTQTMVP